ICLPAGLKDVELFPAVFAANVARRDDTNQYFALSEPFDQLIGPRVAAAYALAVVKADLFRHLCARELTNRVGQLFIKLLEPQFACAIGVGTRMTQEE